MRPINNTRRYDAGDYLNYGNENTGQDSFRLAESEARIGSEMLLEAMNRTMWKFAGRYGITDNEARVLLMDTGVRLPRKFMLRDAA